MVATELSSTGNTNQNLTPCYHCGEPLNGSLTFTSIIQGKSRPMCCAGCKAVADLIIDSGMASFYTQRTHYAETPPESVLRDDYPSYDFGAIEAAIEPHNETSESATIQLLIGGMTCAACSWLIERQALNLPGVTEARVSLTESTLSAKVTKNTTVATLMQRIAELGYRVQPVKTSERTKLLALENMLMLKRLAVAGLGMMQVGMFAIALHAGAIQGIELEYQQLMRWVSLPIALFVVIYSGTDFFRSAWLHLKHGAVVMDLPISIALSLALGASIYATVSAEGEVYFDSVVMFVFFLLVARYFEHRSRFSSSLTLQKIQDALPKLANRVADKVLERCSVGQLNRGDRIRVFSGDTLPLDGMVLRGHSEIDESTFTGESIPRAVSMGDTVFAGTINLKQAIDVEVTSDPDSTKLKALEDAVSFAETQKPRIAQIADRIAGVFILAVLSIASLTAYYWWQHDPENAFWIALSVLVVSCPCALGLATPAALTTAAQRLRQLGAIIRGDNAAEQLSRIDTVIFDKTGTLTDGEFECVEILTLKELSESDCFLLAVSLQAHSSHPIASAFTNTHASVPQATLITTLIQALSDASEAQTPRTTAQGLVFDYQSHAIRLGNESLLKDCDFSLTWPKGNLHWIGLSIDGFVVALFGLKDKLRPDALDLVQYFKDAGIQTVLLTGDASAHARHFASDLPFDDSRFGLSAHDKLEYLSECQQQGACVLMVGDGVNDAAVLAQATVGIAVSRASDLARAKADIVVTELDLNPIKFAHQLALKTRKIIKQNLLWALGYNTVAIPLACLGYIPPWLAAIGMSLSSVIVVLNSLRIKSQSLG